jgi:hypothetical protein
MHDGARCNRGLMTAVLALEDVSLLHVDILLCSAFRAYEAIRKAILKEKRSARFFIIEFSLKFLKSKAFSNCHNRNPPLFYGSIISFALCARNPRMGYIVVCCLKSISAFGYLYKFNSERMTNTRIMLPVDDDGSPDYSYMEQYTKNMMLRKYKQYLAYLDSKEKKKEDT